MDHGRSAVETLDRSLRWPAFGIALLMQLALLAMLRSDPYPPQLSAAAPLQVVWIEQRTAPPIPPWPTAPRRAERTPPARMPRSSAVAERPRATAAIDTPATIDDAPLPAAGALPAYRDAEGERGDARRFGRRTAVLPGSDQAIVDIGAVVRSSITPQQTVALVGAMLFGGRPPEPCEDIEQRIMYSEDPTVRQLELDKLDRCRRR